MTSIVSSLQYLSSGVTSMLLTLNPVVTVLLAQVVLTDDRLTWERRVSPPLYRQTGVAMHGR